MRIDVHLDYLTCIYIYDVCYVAGRLESHLQSQVDSCNIYHTKDNQAFLISLGLLSRGGRLNRAGIGRMLTGGVAKTN